MGYKPRKLTADFPHHITARCNNRERFPVPMHVAWEIFNDYLFLMNRWYGIEIISLVMMANHIHLICRDPNLLLPKAMAIFMRETSKEMGRLSRRVNRLWGGPYFNSVVDSPLYFLHLYKYNYLNPVAAGACKRVEDYPWSTLQVLLGQRSVVFPIQEDETLFSNVQETLNWLNARYDADEVESFRRARKKKLFQFPHDPSTKRRNHLADWSSVPAFTHSVPKS